MINRTQAANTPYICIYYQMFYCFNELGCISAVWSLPLGVKTRHCMLEAVTVKHMNQCKIHNGARATPTRITISEL